MNKISKLLSVSLISSIGVLAPITISSCSKPITPIDMQEVYDPAYVYTDTPAEKSYVTQDSVLTDVLIKNSTNDPSLFIHDAIYGTVAWGTDFEKDVTVDGIPVYLRSFKVGYSEPTFGVTKVMQPGLDDIEYPTISFKQRYVLTYANEFVIEPKDMQITKTVQIDIDYHDVILFDYYPLLDETWHVGLLNREYMNNTNLMFWPLSNNIHPWSISISGIDQKCIIIKDTSEDPEEDPIVINNCQYYSHYVTLASQLLDLWNLIHPEDPSLQSSSNEELTPLEKNILEHIVFWDYKSEYLKNQDLLPSIEIQPSGLNASGNTINNNITFGGVGIKMPERVKGNVSIKSASIAENSPIFFPSFGEDKNSINIGKDAKLTINNLSVSFPGLVDKILPKGSYTFSCDRKYIDLIITYNIGGTDQEPMPQKLYLPQSEFTVTVS